MNFIILSDYFSPIVKSGSIIVGDLVDELIKDGHNVSVVTFVDNQNKECDISILKNLKIIRIRTRSRSFGMVGRLWAEVRYSNKIIKNLSRLNQVSYDGIICYSPSIFYGKAIQWLKKRDIEKAYLIVRDIFPKWALDSNLIKKGFFYNYLKNIEGTLYNSVDIIGIEAKSDMDYFDNHYSAKYCNLEVLNNWGSEIKRQNTDQNIQILDRSMINIVYGGNIGSAQDLLSLISLFDHSILKNKANITIFGSGNQFNALNEVIKVKNLRNIFLMPLVDRDTYNNIMINADVGLISLNEKLSSNNYPLKMIGYMQLGKPILASVNKNNEIINLINNNNLGFASEASDINKFNKNLNAIISRKSLRIKQGYNAFKLFNEKYTAKVAAEQIYRHFK
jgi:O26-antigen biosynthesis N-acetyl-L-fucosamine transferase